MTLWTIAWQAPLSTEFSRQEYWNRLPFPTPGDLPNPETKPASLALAGGFFITSVTWDAPCQSMLTRVNVSDMKPYNHISSHLKRNIQQPFLLLSVLP